MQQNNFLDKMQQNIFLDKMYVDVDNVKHFASLEATVFQNFNWQTN